MAQAEANGVEEGPSNGSAYDYPTNVLWIEIINVTNEVLNGLTNQWAYLTLHGTESGGFYELLSKTNLDEPGWRARQIIYNSTGTNQMFFDPVPTDYSPIMFFEAARGAAPLIAVSISPYGNANEPYPKQLGLMTVRRFVYYNESPATTVYYRISGTAENGVDYTNLPGVINVQANYPNEFIFIDPIADELIEPDETVTASLVLTNGYLLDTNYSGYSAATVIIRNNLFQVVVTNLVNPTGLDYHEPTHSLLASVNYPYGEPNSFVRIYTNGVTTNTIVTNWSGIHGLKEEVKLATVKATLSGFTNGEMFFGTGINGVIGRLSAEGTVWTLNWVTVRNETQETLFRGSFFVDQSGSFGGDLIAVTGGTEEEGGDVWRITSAPSAMRIASITNTHPHLEGVITLTNDVQKWGPWAGKIITGAESALPPLIHAIDTNGVVTSFALGIGPEDFDIIPPNQDLYCAEFNGGRILKLSSALLTNYVGDLLITQELPTPKLFIVHWDPAGSNFITQSIPYYGSFEHVTFAPINLSTIPAQ